MISKTFEKEKMKYFDDIINHKKFLIIKDFVKEKKPKRLLDVGSGIGIISICLNEHVDEIYGIDFSEKNIEKSKTFLKEKGLDSINFKFADAKKIPFKDNFFDMVICSQVLEHVKEPNLVINELIRVSKKHVFIDVPTPLWETWQIFYFLGNKLKSPIKTIRKYNRLKKEREQVRSVLQPDHVNKWFPWKWKSVINKGELEKIQISSCHISPLKSLSFPVKIENKIRYKFPFYYCGMVVVLTAKIANFSK